MMLVLKNSNIWSLTPNRCRQGQIIADRALYNAVNIVVVIMACCVFHNICIIRADGLKKLMENVNNN